MSIKIQVFIYRACYGLEILMFSSPGSTPVEMYKIKPGESEKTRPVCNSIESLIPTKNTEN